MGTITPGAGATITIAGRALGAARPADLAARIENATGLSLDEARTILAGSALPNLLARAIDPLLTDQDRPTLAELGEMIDPEAMEPVAAQVLEIWDQQEIVDHGGE